MKTMFSSFTPPLDRLELTLVRRVLGELAEGRLEPAVTALQVLSRSLFQISYGLCSFCFSEQIV